MSKKDNTEAKVEEISENKAAAVQTEDSTPPAPEKTELELLNEEVADLKDKLLRSIAELDNVRKRTARERETVYLDAKANTSAAFLGCIDNFERALQMPCQDEGFKKGMELIYALLTQTLDSLGVKPFGEKDDKFDPNIHNAVMHSEEEGVEDNTIVEVFEKGYKCGDKLIRPAMVKVAN